MKKEVKESKMINHIKYNTIAFGLGGAEYLVFDAKWDTNNYVSFKIKSIIETDGSRYHRNKKGTLNFDNSRYFISLVNGIDFRQFKKDSKNVDTTIIDGEDNILKVKTDKYCGRIFWQTYALESKYISVIKKLVRICEKYKEPKEVLTRL